MLLLETLHHVICLCICIVPLFLPASEHPSLVSRICFSASVCRFHCIPDSLTSRLLLQYHLDPIDASCSLVTIPLSPPSSLPPGMPHGAVPGQLVQMPPPPGAGVHMVPINAAGMPAGA